MISENVESIGGGYGFGGSNGILGLIALLAVFRGNLFGGNVGDASANLAEINNQLGNIRAEIGDSKFDSLSATLNQTMALMGEISQGRFENMSGLLTQTNMLQAGLNDIGNGICSSTFQLSRQIDANAAATERGFAQTNLNLVRQGYEGQIASLNSHNQLSRQIAECCCETNMNIERTAFATQLRDLENKCSTDRQLTEIKCLIADTAKDAELASLRRDAERGFISHEINKAINTTVGHWAADRAFNGPTYPAPPYNGAWGF